MINKINLEEKFGLFAEQWRPKVIARLDGQEVKVVKVKGEFPWHLHEAETSSPSFGREEAHVPCFEPAGVVNTRNVTDAIYTAPNDVSI